MPRSSSAPPPSSRSTDLAKWVNGKPNSALTSPTSPTSPWASNSLILTEAGKNRVQTAFKQQDRRHLKQFCKNFGLKLWKLVHHYLHKKDVICLSRGQHLLHLVGVHGQRLLTKDILLGICKEQRSFQMVWVDDSNVHHICTCIKAKTREITLLEERILSVKTQKLKQLRVKPQITGSKLLFIRLSSAIP